MDFLHERGRMPNFSDVMVLFKYKSRNSAFYLVQQLIDAGLIAKDKNGFLSIPKDAYSIPVVGVVPAGFASPVDEQLTDSLSLSDFLIRNKEASYILQVTGDSMKDAGIHNGDMVIFERTTNVKDGDIVVALTEDGYTLKYLRRVGHAHSAGSFKDKQSSRYVRGDVNKKNLSHDNSSIVNSISSNRVISLEHVGDYYLEPANADYPNIYPKDGQVIGVVVATFRKYTP